MRKNVNELAAEIHRTATCHGFWDAGSSRNFGEMLMLVVSECAEALEEDRAGNPLIYWKCKLCGHSDVDSNDVVHYQNGAICPEKNLKPEGALVEVADAIIRLMDTGHHLASKTPFSLQWVIEHKMDYNDSREHMHGKAY